MNMFASQRGSILLSVVVAITLLAAISYMLSFQGAGQANMTSGERERDRLRYIAEAGVAHARLQLAQNTSCNGYTDIPKTDFAGDSYSVSFITTKDSPVKFGSTAESQSGAKFKLKVDGELAYQPSVAIELQLSKTGGQDAILDDFYSNRNYGGANYVEINSASWQQRPVLQFDLSSIPAGVKIVSAQLELLQQSMNKAGAVAVHRMTRDWVEGTRNGGGTSDGADWQTHDGTSSWAQLGGEFDATVYGVTQVSGAKSGGWVAWDIGDLVQEWVSGTSPNYGLLLAGDGIVTGAKYASKDTSDPLQAPKLTIAYTCECGKTCGAGPAPGKNVLLVVGDAGNPVTSESDRKSLIESWGHTVTLISDHASQADFDTAFADADVAYIAGSGSSGEVGTKLTAATIGVLSEDIGLVDELGIAEPAFLKRSSQAINVIDNTHYVTDGFGLGTLQLYTYTPQIWTVSGALAPGLQLLGETQDGGSSYPPGLAILDAGAELWGGGSAAGRRVQVPWSEGSFDINGLNADGQTIFQRAIEWGAGAPVAANDGWAVGDNGTIYYTADAGASWAAQASGTTQSLYSVIFPTPTIGYAAGTGEILLKTTNGGNAWNTLSTGTNSLWALDFLDADIGYTVGLGATVKMTTDGGSNWANQDPATTQNLRHIEFVDASTGYLAGLGGVIRKTTNGGTNWSAQNSGVTTALYSIDFADASTGWAVGDVGVIVKTTDGGTSWNSQTSGTSNKLQSVVAIDSATALAVGRVGLILKTTDGGSSWVTQASGTTGDLWYVDFVDATTGYVTGQNGEILKTTDGGSTWTSTDLGTSVTIRAIYFAKNGAGTPPTAPIAHWKFDETSGTTASDSEGGHHGTLVGDASWAPGVLGGGISLDGAGDRVDVSGLINSPSSLTIAAWVNLTSTDFFGAEVIDLGDNVLMRLDNGFYDTYVSFWDGSNWQRTRTGEFLAGSGWRHVAYTHDDAANQQFFYIDGAEAASTTFSTSISYTHASNTTIGANSLGNSNYDFNGQIDDVRIYDRALDGAEIAALAAEGGGGGGPGGGGGGGGGCDGNFRDNFDTRAWNGSNGSLSWATDWIEVGESNDPTSGDIQVMNDQSNYQLRTRDNDNGGEGAEREADLSGAATATLSYDYRRMNLDSSSDYTSVEISANGAAGPWTELTRHDGSGNDSNYQPASHPITAYISANTRIRFKTSSSMGNTDTVWFDNIEITCAP